MQLCNLPGAVVLVMGKMGWRGRLYIKERKINVLALLPGNRMIRRTRTGHLPLMAEFNHRKVNVRILLDNVTQGYAFFGYCFFSSLT